MRKRHEDLTAWDMTIKGLWHLHRATPHDFREALALLEDATRVDPGFACRGTSSPRPVSSRRSRAGRAAGSGSARGLSRRARGGEHLRGARPGLLDGPRAHGRGGALDELSFPRARLHADKAIELNPERFDGAPFLRLHLRLRGDLKGAIATQRNVYRVDPRYGHAEVVEADLGLWHLLEGDLVPAGEHLGAFDRPSIRRTCGPGRGRSSWRGSQATRHSRARRFGRSKSWAERWTSSTWRPRIRSRTRSTPSGSARGSGGGEAQTGKRPVLTC